MTATGPPYLPSTETAATAAREVGSVASGVNFKIFEALTTTQERMARLEISQRKREESEHMKDSAKTEGFRRRLKEILDRRA
ncbi:unnamed protein product [Peronospora destructor]|uniref:Uncharacterized protein n=1 Tax=Peronospora destructor TaxID=86335 RepID=A0AAV0V004_9STRA|nr:unnamed protein product [Peronospora destructor]